MIIMILLVVAFILKAAGDVLEHRSRYSGCALACYVLFSFACVAVGIMLISLPISRVDAGANIAAMQTMEKQLHDSRSFDALERATIQNKVARYNTWLAKAKYYRTTMWNLWYPSSVDTARYINQSEELIYG